VWGFGLVAARGVCLGPIRVFAVSLFQHTQHTTHQHFFTPELRFHAFSGGPSQVNSTVTEE
jgi:hypothetical protein